MVHGRGTAIYAFEGIGESVCALRFRFICLLFSVKSALVESRHLIINRIPLARSNVAPQA
jgi:hypothetical protein